MSLEIGQKVSFAVKDSPYGVEGYVTEITPTLFGDQITVSAYPPGEGPFINLPLYFGENP